MDEEPPVNKTIFIVVSTHGTICTVPGDEKDKLVDTFPLEPADGSVNLLLVQMAAYGSYEVVSSSIIKEFTKIVQTYSQDTFRENLTLKDVLKKVNFIMNDFRLEQQYTKQDFNSRIDNYTHNIKFSIKSLKKKREKGTKSIKNSRLMQFIIDSKNTELGFLNKIKHTAIHREKMKIYPDPVTHAVNIYNKQFMRYSDEENTKDIYFNTINVVNMPTLEGKSVDLMTQLGKSHVDKTTGVTETSVTLEKLISELVDADITNIVIFDFSCANFMKNASDRDTRRLRRQLLGGTRKNKNKTKNI
jgi:hypothetical protein